MLYKKEIDWTPSQATRASVLFKYYPEIEKDYRLTIKFREWYAKNNVGKNIKQIKDHLHQWSKEVTATSIPEMLNFISFAERHKGVICNYFLTGQTNAKAEAINKTIQSIVTNYVNTRNIDFAHFRFVNILS